jgi:hypothetical protein
MLGASCGVAEVPSPLWSLSVARCERFELELSVPTDLVSALAALRARLNRIELYVT